MWKFVEIEEFHNEVGKNVETIDTQNPCICGVATGKWMCLCRDGHASFGNACKGIAWPPLAHCCSRSNGKA